MRSPLCNNRPATAIPVFGCRLPLCARCCGFCLGIAMVGSVWSADGQWAVQLAGVACIAFFAFDGWRSYFTRQGTTNAMRLISGALGGGGSAILLVELL